MLLKALSPAPPQACEAGAMFLVPKARAHGVLGTSAFGMLSAQTTDSSILAWEIHGQRSLATYSPWGRKGRHDLVTKPSP